MKKFEQCFDKYYEFAKKYYEENGNLRVHVDYIIETPEEKIELGLWIYYLRRAKSGSINFSLTKEQIAKMDAIHMEWTVYLNDFKSNYDFLVKNSSGEDIKNILSNKKFKQWIDNKKGEYDSGIISDERRKMMDQNIQLFNLKHLRWEYHYYYAKKYYEEFGNLDVPNDYEINGVKLWHWLETQRRNLYSLSEEQILKLEQIDMIWWVSEYRYIHSQFDIYTKKRFYQKLNNRFAKFLNMYEDEIFETKEQVKTLEYNFMNYLDSAKK